MQSIPLVDFERFYASNSDTFPAGPNLRQEAPENFQKLMDVYAEARDRETRLPAEQPTDAETSADWSAVLSQAEALLVQSKDLEIAAIMVVALVKQHGFAGLRDGLCLLCWLLQNFWGHLHAGEEDGETALVSRREQFEFLNNELPDALKHIPLTRSQDGKDYALFHWEEAEKADSNPRVTSTNLKAAVDGTSPAF